MYVCLCAGVSDSKIKSMVRDGSARTLCDVMKHSRAGVTCGACVCQLKEILQQHAEENQQPPTGIIGAAASGE